MAKKPPLGSGERFATLKSSLAKRPGVKNPGALAAAIGRKKYGPKKFAALSHHSSPVKPNPPNPANRPNVPRFPKSPTPPGVEGFQPNVRAPGIGGRF